MIRRIERRGERVIVIDICYRKPDGTNARYRRDAQVQTIAAATAEERRILASIAQYGAPYPPTTPEETAATAPPKPAVTFQDVVLAFRAARSPTLKPSTRITYDEIINTRLMPRWRDASIDAIGFEAMSILDAGLVTEGLSASRRRNAAIVMRSLLKYAVASARLARMPELPPLPKVGETVADAPSMSDVRAILAAASPAGRVACALAAYAGLRAGEVRGLRAGDVDRSRKVIVVRQATTKGETAAPKSGNEREVPISAALALILRDTLPKDGDALVATTTDGHAWGEWGLRQVVARACKRAKLGRVWRFHDLRHAFVTALFDAGVPAPVVQRLAGHADLSVTQRYAHTNRVTLRAGIDALDRGNSEATAS